MVILPQHLLCYVSVSAGVIPAWSIRSQWTGISVYVMLSGCRPAGVCECDCSYIVCWCGGSYHLSCRKTLNCINLPYTVWGMCQLKTSIEIKSVGKENYSIVYSNTDTAVSIWLCPRKGILHIEESFALTLVAFLHTPFVQEDNLWAIIWSMNGLNRKMVISDEWSTHGGFICYVNTCLMLYILYFLVLQPVLQAFLLVCPCISLRGYKLEKYN